MRIRSPLEVKVEVFEGGQGRLSLLWVVCFDYATDTRVGAHGRRGPVSVTLVMESYVGILPGIMLA